ncbi:MAG: PhzF family phenazine biosynthesis protein [Anaerolineae bacterium]|nr:PhzF family phenazine biosynthesis protein [Anaerolineae bacterium]MDW8071043.1 PhzF family phenazine biosynthesis protein [Anaerolineae bacterium]
MDFVSRFFAPRVGITEDPVTGMGTYILDILSVAEIGQMSSYRTSALGARWSAFL